MTVRLLSGNIFLSIRSSSRFAGQQYYTNCLRIFDFCGDAQYHKGGRYLMPRSQPAVRTCYGSCVSGAAAELRLKFCVSCGWWGSENDSAATVPATHVSCGRRASDAPNRTQKIPQRRHVQRTGTVLSRYLQRAFAVPPATCPYVGVRICTSVARRRCVEGTTHVRRTHGHILPAQSM